ncbi:MAG: ABC transporter substrate-binding protein [Huintestinicola sp.]
MKFTYILFVTVLLMLASLCGCSEIEEPVAETTTSVTEAEPEPYPVTVGKLTFSASPMRVCSLSPAVTEMICELGFEDRIIGRSSYCSYPESILSVPDAGSGANPDLEKIISLSPQLVISQSPIANKDVTRLEEAGISVMILPAPVSNDSLFEEYLTIAKIFIGSLECEAAAENALADYRSAVKDAADSSESLVLIMQTLDGGFSVGTGDSFMGDYVSCFGRNIAEDNTSFFMTDEELMNADPQVIFLAYPLEMDDIPEDVSDSLSAYENNRVYVIDTSLLERPTARLASNTRAIAEAVSADAAEDEGSSDDDSSDTGENDDDSDDNDDEDISEE